MRSRLALFATASILAAVSAAPVTAQPYGNKAQAQTSSVSSKDKNLTMTAAEAGMAEVKFGQLAEKKATHPEVRQFAQQMVKDHSAANKELAAWARTKFLPLPPQLNAKHRAEYAKLTALSGPAFDKAYMQGQVADHKMAVALHRKGNKQADNGDLKNFFAKHTPHIEMHLQMAEQIFQKLQ
jgi:putative membrane protein